MTMHTPTPAAAPSAINGARSARTPIQPAPEVVLRRYAAFGPLAAADIALLRSLSAQSGVVAGQELDCEGAAAHAPRLILSGWACRFRMLADGRRTILSFLVPGDVVGSRRQAPALANTLALTPCHLLDARPIWRAVSTSDPAHARLARAQRILDVLDDCYMLDHIVRLGRQTATERMCHLLLELRWRLHAVGLAPTREFALPLTQEAIGDAVGLSIVHVNRTLQDLRRRGLIELRQGRVVLLEAERMAEIAEFRPPFSAHAELGALLTQAPATAN
jgi:CRP-like cAMP-binding protein